MGGILRNLIVIAVFSMVQQSSETGDTQCYDRNTDSWWPSTILTSCNSGEIVNIESLNAYENRTPGKDCTCTTFSSDCEQLHVPLYNTIKDELNNCSRDQSCNVSKPVCSEPCVVIKIDFTCHPISTDVPTYGTDVPTDPNTANTVSESSVSSSSSSQPPPSSSSSSALSSSSSSSSSSSLPSTSGSEENTSSTISTLLNSTTGSLLKASGGGFPKSHVAGVLVAVILSSIGVVLIVLWKRKKRKASQSINDGKVKLHIVVNEGYIDRQVIPDPQPRIIETGNEYLELSEVNGPEVATDVSEDVEYNVLNLKTLPVKADPTYGHLASVGDDVSDQYSHVTRHQTSGSADDTYAHTGIVDAKAVNGEVENTYAHTGAVDEKLAKSVVADDTYAHTSAVHDKFEHSCDVDDTYAHTDSSKTEFVDDATYNTLKY